MKLLLQMFEKIQMMMIMRKNVRFKKRHIAIEKIKNTKRSSEIAFYVSFACGH